MAGKSGSDLTRCHAEVSRSSAVRVLGRQHEIVTLASAEQSRGDTQGNHQRHVEPGRDYDLEPHSTARASWPVDSVGNHGARPVANNLGTPSSAGYCKGILVPVSRL